LTVVVPSPNHYSDHAVAVRDVLGTLAPERPLAYTTVMTVMDNLHRKGFLRREKHGRAYVYEPTKPRSQHAADLMAELLDVSGDRSATLLSFLGQMTPDDAASLRRALGSHVDEDPQ
jgi:predicted transcriptional regulator